MVTVAISPASDGRLSLILVSGAEFFRETLKSAGPFALSNAWIVTVVVADDTLNDTSPWVVGALETRMLSPAPSHERGAARSIDSA